MKSPLKILTTAAVAGALVAGGIAGAAPAFADTEVTVTPTIAVSIGAVVVPALTESAPITINTTAGYHTDVSAVIVYNGATYSAPVYQDSAGNAAVDLISVVSRAVFNYSDVVAGAYTVTFTSTQDDGYDFSTDPTTHYTYLPAARAPVAFTVTKLSSKVVGFKGKTTKARHGKLLKIGTTKLINAGYPNSGKLQYKKKGGKWKNVYNGDLYVYSTEAHSKTVKLTSFNKVAKKGIMARGTWYVRVVIPTTPFVTGSKSKAVKLTVK